MTNDDPKGTEMPDIREMQQRREQQQFDRRMNEHFERETLRMRRIEELVTIWRRDADQYMRQVDEARKAGTPYDQMISMASVLRTCAQHLETILGQTTEACKAR